MIPEDLVNSQDPKRLPEYLAYFKGMVQDLTHWHGYQCYTPRDVADYLTLVNACDLSKERNGVRIRFQTVEAAQAYLNQCDAEDDRAGN